MDSFIQKPQSSQSTSSQGSMSSPLQSKPRPQVSRHIFIFALVMVTIFVLFYASVYFSLNSKLDQITRTPKNPQLTQIPLSPTSIADPTVNWKTYTNSSYRFKHPFDWSITKDSNATILTNPSKTITIKFSNEKYLFTLSGYNEDNITRKNIIVNLGNTEYGTSETTLKNTSLYVYLFTHKPQTIYILFGTGYPVNRNSSLSDYKASKDTIHQILSTFKFIVQQQVLCPQDVKVCQDGSYVSRQPPSCEFTPCQR